MLLLAGLILGLALGGLLAWLYARGQTAALTVELEHERARGDEKVALLQKTEQDFSSKFDALAADAKTRLKPLLDAHADPTGDQDRYVDDFVRHVRQHAKQLSEKAYWQQFDDAPDYVFMFLPGESFFRTAIERDPSLLELAGKQ